MDNMCSDQPDTRTLAPGPGHGTKTLDSMSVVKKSAAAKLRVSGGSKDWGISELVDLSGNGRNETRNDRVDHYHADTLDTAVRSSSLQVRQHKNFMKLQKSKSFENELQKSLPVSMEATQKVIFSLSFKVKLVKFFHKYFYFDT